MAVHHHPFTLALSARFECVCGWRADSTDPETADAEFLEHLRSTGYRVADYLT